MNKKRKTLFVALLSVFTTAGLLAACKPGKDITEIPADKDYGFTNPSVQHMPPDAGYNIDGVLDEEGYKNSTWIHLHNDNGTSVVDMAMTSRYGEKGMYFAYDVTENTPIYVNPERASYINSGIEMYLAPNGVTSMSSENIFEIDLEADGTLTFKRNNGQPGQWANVATTSDIMAYLAAQPKGGEVNTEECYGYTLEFFIPWDYLSWLGLNVDTIKEEAVYVNPVHITSYNYEGNDHNRDRYWYSFATQLGGDGWGNVNQYFKFGANGAVGTVPITIGEGVHCTLSGPDAVMPGLPATITVTPESGYSVTSFKCNNAESVKLLNYNEDGSATYTVYGAEGGITFSAEAEEVTAGKKTLSGKINLKKAGGDTYDNLVASYTDADGLHDLAVDANGRFTLADLAQGYYTIEVEKEGYGSVKRGIYLNRDTEIQIDFEFATFDKVDGTCWDILNANDGYVIKRSGRGAILSKNSYGTFYAEANFRYDEALAAKSNADEYYQQRMGFRIKFSEGKYWHPDVMCEAGSFKVTYGKILNSESIFNWDTVHTMNAKQIAKYKSAEGIKLGILRVGTTAYIYLDGELVSTTDLGAQGIKADETAQIGFEGYVYNTENVRVNYVFKDKNANEVVLNDVNSVGGSVQFDDSYKIGNDLLLVLDKENASDVLLSLLVDGEEMSGEVVTEEDGTQMLTIRANKKLVLNVTAVYGSAGEVTANIAVESAWKANGIKFTFTDAEDDSLVYTATVANNKMTVENMKKGLYEVTAEVFGAKVDLGAYSVVSGEEKLLEVEKVFINGKALDSAVIDLSNGEFIYHSAIDENYSIKLNAEKGDAYLASRISLTAQDKATLLKGGEVSFGMYMTVEDEDGKAHTHWVDFWFKNAGDDNWLSLRTDFGWAEDICKPLTTAIDVNKYSKALFGDGLYVVLRYNSEKGVMETYFGDKDYNVAYLRDWNDANNLFPKNGKVTALGFRDNLTWGGTPVSATVQGFRYGRTLMEALGVEGKTIEITGVGEKANGEISVPATQCGGDVTITLIPDNGYKVASLTVNGEAVDISEITGGRTYIIKNYMGAKLTVDATFEQTVNSSVDAVVSGVKLGETQSLAGKTVTLSGNGLANVTEKIDGNGHLVIQSIPTGTWNLEVEGYLPTTITIAENAAYDTAIVLECDTFKELLHWGKFDFTKQNDETPEIKITNDSAAIITNDTYGSDVMASIYLDGNNFAAGSSMGLMFRFVGDNMNDLVVLNMQGTKKVHFAESSLWAEYGAPTKDTKMAAGAGWKNLLYFIDCDDDGASRTADAHSEEYMADFAKGTLKLSALRKGNVIYAFLNDRYIGQQVLNEKYANAKCEAGFIAACGNNGEWKSWKCDITDDADNFPVLTAAITNKTTDTNGKVTLSAATAEVGSSVTVKVEPNDGYVIGTVKVNGTDVTDKLSDGEYTFTLNGATEVEATFEEIVVGSINAEVSGKKLGVAGNSLSGDMQVVLTSATAGTKEAALTTVEGKTVLKVDEIPAGKWTVTVEGYLAAEIEVAKNGEYTTAIALECDTFKELLHWGKFDFTKQNDETPEIKVTNDSAAIITNDTYGSDVMVSIYLNGSNIADGSSMGLMFRFVGDGMNDLVVLNMQGTKKVHFAESSLWSDFGAPTKDTKMAAGAGWKNLIYFIDCDDDGASRTADAHSEEYMADFTSGTLKLSALRKGNVIYAFLNGRYIGQQVLNEKYANAKCEAGFIASCGKKDEWSSWKFDITDDADNFPALTVKVTDETANEAHGTVSGIPAEAVALGDEVTVTVNPENGYKLKALTVNGVDVTAKISGKEYTFTVNGETTVIATFEEITVGSIAAEITGKKMGVTGNALAAGTKVTLTAAGLDAVETQTVEKDGKIVISIEEIPAATWTVNVDRYFTTELTVEKNAEFNTAIALEYDLLENLTTKWGWGDKADLSRQNDGIIQQAGGVTQWVSSKDTYNNVAVTASLLSGGHRQGVFVRFGNEYLMVQKENDEKISWNGESNLWGQGTNLISATWTEYIKPLDMNNTQYTVTLVREANKIFVFVNGNYYDTKTLADTYADAKCYVGIYCTECPSGERTFEITEDISKYRKNVALTTEAEEEQGTIVVDNADGLKAGDTVTITVEAKEGFIIGTVTVGDVDVTAKLSNGEYTFNITGDTTVVATFEEKQVGSMNAEVIGKKFAVTGNSLTDGTKVTLTSAIAGTKEATLTDVEGKIMLKVDELVVGNWTVKVDEYIEAEITVEKDTEYTEAITLEYDGAFVKRLNWGSFDWSHINDGDNAYFVASNGCQMVMTKDTYGDTAFTMYLGGENRQGGNQGLFFLFGTEAVYVRLENNATKLHFSKDFEWMTNNNDKIGETFSMADGHDWQNLIHLKNNNEGTADADAQNLLSKYEAGTLKLTVVRRGATFYAFLDDRYVGQRTFNSKYADMKASVGVTWSGLSDGVNKTFKVDMPEIWTYHITNATAENANGSVVVSDSDPRIGDKVTLTINPVDGYIVKSLTVGGKDVTGSVTFDKTTLIGTYEFNITGDVTVAAEFEEATYGSIESAVSANKYGETGPIEMNGTVVKLSSAMTEYEITVADGKIVQDNVLAGVYTVVKEGYIPHTVTITADGTYSEAITFVYQLFTSVPASADLSEISSGKVTATGKGGIDLVTKESYNEFTAEAVFDVPDYNSRRYSISLVFDDGKNFRVDLAVQDGGNNILQETDWSSMMSFKWDWVDFPEGYFAAGTNSYTEQEIRDEFIAKGLTYKLERTGSVIKLYINGVLMKTYELKSEYANKSAQLRFVQDSNGTDGTKGFTFDISVPEVTD